MLVSEIEIKLRQKEIRILGKNIKANITTRLTRAKKHFIRVAPGTYGLIELEHKPSRK